MSTTIRYPRLITLLRHQASLTITESVAIIERRESEASLHYGGREKCLNDAIAARHRLYKLYNNSPCWLEKPESLFLLLSGAGPTMRTITGGMGSLIQPWKWTRLRLDFLYEDTGKHHAVIQVGSMMLVVEHNSMLRHMYSTTRYQWCRKNQSRKCGIQHS